MASYVVMEDPAAPGKADGVAIIRDGFSWTAFIFGPIWLLWHRLWAEALIAIVIAFGAVALLPGNGLAGSLLSLVVPLYLGLEGQGMRVAALARRGWLEWGVVEAANLDDADLRYAAETDDFQERSADPAPIRPTQAGLALGLNHVPGRP